MKDELEKIYRAIDKFAEAMKKKMEEKYYKGYSGWDNIKGEEAFITKRLIEHAQRGKGQEVDVANFAMMLWNSCRPRISMPCHKIDSEKCLGCKDKNCIVNATTFKNPK